LHRPNPSQTETSTGASVAGCVLVAAFAAVVTVGVLWAVQRADWQAVAEAATEASSPAAPDPSAGRLHDPKRPKDPSSDAPLGTRRYDAVRQALLQAVNSDRVAAGRKPVEFDRKLSDLGDEHCWAMLRGGYVSHWSSDGLKPYHRYSLAGGAGYHAQNVAWRRSSAGFADPERARAEALLSHEAMMAERAPNDGHRRTILDERATLLGIGVAIEGECLAFTHEFGSSEVEFVEPAERGVSPGAAVRVAVSVPEGVTLSLVAVQREPPPTPLSSAQLAVASDYEVGGESVGELRPLLGTGWEYRYGSRGELGRSSDGLYRASYVMPGVAGLYDLLAVMDGEVRAVLTLACPPDIVADERYRWPAPRPE